MKEKCNEVAEERWKTIPGYEGWYEISDLGRVKRMVAGQGAIAGRILSPGGDGGGYLIVGLSINGTRRHHKVRRLVAAAFLGPCPEGKEVNHKDGNKKNNCPENLEYMTHSENMSHAYKTGLASQRGKNNGNRKLTEEKACKIRRLLADGQTQTSIAVRFGVCTSTINAIASGERWVHLKEEEEK